MCINMYDNQEYQLYFLKSIKKNVYVINVNSSSPLFNKDEVKYLVDELASKNNVMFIQNTYSSAKNTNRMIVSENSWQEICKYFKVNSCELSNVINTTEIDSFLHNDNVEYLTIKNDLDSSSTYWDNNFILASDNYGDIDHFIQDFAKATSINMRDFTLHKWNPGSTYYDIQSVILTTSAVFVGLIYVLSLLQIALNQSRHMGILLLLGFDFNKIFKNFIKIDLLAIGIYTISEQFLILFVDGATVHLRYMLLMRSFVLSMIILVINLWVVRKVTRTVNAANILKKQKLEHRVYQINIFAQFFLYTFISIALVVSSMQLHILNKANKEIEKSSYLLDYGVIGTFGASFLEAGSYTITHDLYHRIKEDTYLKDRLLYTEFWQYHMLLDSTIVHPDYKYDDMFAVVSSNYFALENITLYNKDGKTDSLEDYQEKYVLVFPQTYAFDKQIVVDNYFKINSLYDRSKETVFLYYHNTEAKTYSYTIPYVDSPVFALAKDDVMKLPYDSYNGLSFIGNSLDTGLKFLVETKEEKHLIVNSLKQIFGEFGLVDQFQKQNFYTVRDYFNEDIQRVELGFRYIIPVFIGLYILLWFSKMQFIRLYLNTYEHEIRVKKMLGFASFRIFNGLIIFSILTYFVLFLMGIGLMVMFKLEGLNYFVIFALSFAIIDGLMVYLLTHLNIKRKSVKELKGGYALS